ncbi:hypothetical protein RP20_CCG022686 [Aedes albopictus]|nr:hypothetical protein RP20_CCG022686 [Aedes albopictus]
MGSGSFQNPFEGLLSKPVKFRTSSNRDSHKTPKYIVYPSASQSVFSDRTSGNNAVAMDRFAPGEAYGGTVYKIVKAREEKIKNGYQYQKPNAAFDDSKTNAPSPTTPPPPPPPPPAPITVQALPPPITPPPLPPLIVGPTPSPVASPPAPAPTAATPTAPQPPSNQYIPPSDLYLFAPNVHSHYPQQMNGDAQFSGVSSYLPPPAGASDDAPPADSNPSPPSPPSNQYIPPEGLFQFPPNIHSHYHPAPPEDGFQFNGISSYLPPPAGPSDAYLPPTADDSQSTPPPADSNDMIGTIPIGPDTPYPSYLPPSGPPQPAPAPMKKPPPPPPPPAPTMAKDMSAQPVELSFNPHDHESYFPYDHYPHDHFPHDHYPEYIFDHDHHHDEPTTAAPPPPPPPPPADAGTARVKNYSYYYLSRTLWYVPLYFTLYFCFYVLILILRSIARHKVNYPNQWTGRSLQSMQFVTNDEVVNKADIMATFVMKQIDDFKEKYL